MLHAESATNVSGLLIRSVMLQNNGRRSDAFLRVSEAYQANSYFSASIVSIVIVLHFEVLSVEELRQEYDFANQA